MLPARLNPFRVECLHALQYRLQDTCWAEIDCRLASCGYRGAVVGPEGSGKTTFMLELVNRLQKQGYQAKYYCIARDGRLLREQWRQLCQSASGTFVLVDGAEILSLIRWKYLQARLQATAGIVLGLHQDARLPTIYRSKPNIALFRGLVEELLANTTIPLELPPLDEVFRKNQGDIRKALRELYQHAACCTLPKNYLPAAGSLRSTAATSGIPTMHSSVS